MAFSTSSTSAFKPMPFPFSEARIQLRATSLSAAMFSLVS
jgi:hypothetical protein